VMVMFHKGEFLEQMGNYQFFNKASALWSWKLIYRKQQECKAYMIIFGFPF
jgi:hypothetical protein